MQTVSQTTDVLITGAGPSGLMMACLLSLWGIPYRIIDKKDQGTTCSGALVLQARSMEIMDQLGIADKALKAGVIANKIKISFNQKEPISLNIRNLGDGLAKFPYLLMLKQSKTEELLESYINSYSTTIERKTELMSFSQDRNCVTSLLRLPDGSLETLSTKYLIGADGGRSFVREQLNIPFLGKTHELALFVLDTKADTDLQPDEIYFSFTKNTSTGIFPLLSGKWRIDGTLPKESKNKDLVTFQDISKKFITRTPQDIQLKEPDWFSVFRSHQRFAETYRQGRCFLIGDAAHIFSPVGAQGMNYGMQDAYNLAWKLALIVKNEAAISLLDSYHLERQVLAKKMVRSTETAFQLVSSEGSIAKFLRLRIFPSIVTILFPVIEKNKSLGQFIFKRISEIGISYHRHFATKRFSNGRFPQKAPKTGDRLPYMRYTLNGVDTSTYEKVKPVSFHLLIFAKQDKTQEYKLMTDNYKFLTTEIIPYNQETATLFKRFGVRSEGCYLIRPDMHIAYRSKWLDSKVERFLDNFLK